MTRAWVDTVSLVAIEGAPRAVEATPEPTPCIPKEERGEPRGLHRRDVFPRGEVVLTFDDGPYTNKTPDVLALLAKHQLPATFFVLGRHISSRTYHLLQQMEAAGHIIGSHSYDHDIKMARLHSATTIPYIRGQHETTRMLI